MAHQLGAQALGAWLVGANGVALGCEDEGEVIVARQRLERSATGYLRFWQTPEIENVANALLVEPLRFTVINGAHIV
jgi:hypothetical protein